MNHRIMNKCYLSNRLALVAGITLTAVILLTPPVFAQQNGAASPDAIGGPATDATPDEIAGALENLGSRRFRQRQSAFETLIAAGKAAVAALERGAESESLEASSRCVEALAQIAEINADAENNDDADRALAALDRLSASQTTRVADLASAKFKRLMMSHEDRAVEALSRAGARITRDAEGNIRSVTVGRDRDVARLRHLPSIHFVSLVGPGITDTGVASLVEHQRSETLALMRTSVTSDGLSSLKEMKSLERLSLFETPLTIRGVQHLADIRNLRSLSVYHLEDQAVFEALPQIRQIEKLSLHDPQMNNDFASVLNRFGALKELDLNLTDVNDHDCHQLAKIELSLDLRIFRSEEITPEGWQSLGKASLVALSLYSTSLDDTSLTHLASLNELTRLSISDADISDAGIKKLEKLDKLRYVIFRGTDVTEAGAARLKEALPKAFRVSVSKGRLAPRIAAPPPRPAIHFLKDPRSGGKNAYLRSVLTDEIVEELKKETDLSRLSLRHDDTTDEHLKMLEGISMKGIWVTSDKITSDGINSLQGHVGLESVRIGSRALDDRCLKTFIQLPALSSLQLSRVGFTQEGVRSLVDGLAADPKLETLHLIDCSGATDMSLRQLGRLSSLRTLIVRDNAGVTSQLFETVGSLQNLTYFSFNRTIVDNQHIEQISHLDLTNLNLDDSRFGEGVAATIAASFGNLTQLHLQGVNLTGADIDAIGRLKQLTSLSLGKTSVGDERLDGLNRLADLQFLRLSDTAVSDQGLAKLDGLKKLKYLYVDSTAVTGAGIERFKQTHPDVKVYHDDRFR